MILPSKPITKTIDIQVNEENLKYYILLGDLIDGAYYLMSDGNINYYSRLLWSWYKEEIVTFIPTIEEWGSGYISDCCQERVREMISLGLITESEDFLNEKIEDMGYQSFLNDYYSEEYDELIDIIVNFRIEEFTNELLEGVEQYDDNGNVEAIIKYNLILI